MIERNARLTAIEVKLSQTPDSRAARTIDRLRAFYGQEAVAGAYVACTTEVPFEPTPGVTAVPGWTSWNLDGRPSATPTVRHR